jgi:hypothetical protein
VIAYELIGLGVEEIETDDVRDEDAEQTEESQEGQRAGQRPPEVEKLSQT